MKSGLLDTNNCYYIRKNSEADLPISINIGVMNFVATK